MKSCEDCGTRLLSDGTCPNCDEEVLIYQQESDFQFSDEFMRAVDDGEKRAASRKFPHMPL
jgi:uncharacterized Zn finger protein (UPF0148 family)